MGFKMARLRLAVLNAHKGLRLIFYLLHKNANVHHLELGVRRTYPRATMKLRKMEDELGR